MTADDYVVLPGHQGCEINYGQMMTMAEAFFYKAKFANPRSAWIGQEDDWLRGTVLQVIVDTLFVVDGTIPLDDLADWR